MDKKVVTEIRPREQLENVLRFVEIPHPKANIKDRP